jgi:hypothetical protein
MELYQAIVVAIALANLAVTVWLLRLLLPVWRELRRIVFALDHYDFDRLINQFLNGEKPVAEAVDIKVSEKKEEGYREITVTGSTRSLSTPGKSKRGLCGRWLRASMTHIRVL